jgi:hypothetical protein
MFSDWLEYRKEIKKPYKSPRSIVAAFKELKQYSGGDIAVAIKVIDQSIAKGWQGLFELKENNKQKSDYFARKDAADKELDAHLKKQYGFLEGRTNGK